MSQPRNPALLIRLINLIGNLSGAVVAFLYFRVVDRAATKAGEVGLHEIILSIVAFGVLVAIGTRFGNRWLAPIGRAVAGEPLSEGELAVVRRRVLLFPYFMAGLTMVGWTLAGLIFGIAIPPLMGAARTPLEVARQVFGITVIAGGATAAFIFFASEHMWRRRLPFFFPEGDLRAVRRVPRLAVRTRLLAIFLMIGVVPLVLLSIVS